MVRKCEKQGAPSASKLGATSNVHPASFVDFENMVRFLGFENCHHKKDDKSAVRVSELCVLATLEKDFAIFFGPSSAYETLRSRTL
jgi:hypothetical protein